MAVAFVSGAASGIGRAIALRLAKDGYNIAVNDIASKDVSSVLDEIRQTLGRKAISVPADVSKADEVEAAVQKTVTELGSVDVMVANAGVAPIGSLLDITSAEWDRTLSINLGGVKNCYQSGARQMIKQGKGGRLIGASSIMGKKGGPGVSAYCASKFAVRGLTQCAAFEFGKYGITANCYCPTVIDTPMVRDPQTGKFINGMDSLVLSQPLSRVGTVDDVANVVSWLCDEKSNFITGQSILVDGGAIMS